MQTTGANGSGWRVKALACCAALWLCGCGSTDQSGEKQKFFTSGSREADQRASQRMAKEDQLAGPDKDKGERTKEAGEAAKIETRLTLYERLGQGEGIRRIVDDFIVRAIQDPRVNWDRSGVARGGGFWSWFRRKDPEAVQWNGNTQAIAQLKEHFVQFLSLATGGPPKYDGKEIGQSHAGMQITNPQFDAAVGDLKASLDRLQIADREQKELLAVVESTRAQIVTKR